MLTREELKEILEFVEDYGEDAAYDEFCEAADDDRAEGGKVEKEKDEEKDDKKDSDSKSGSDKDDEKSSLMKGAKDSLFKKFLGKTE